MNILRLEPEKARAKENQFGKLIFSECAKVGTVAVATVTEQEEREAGGEPCNSHKKHCFEKQCFFIFINSPFCVIIVYNIST